MPVERLEWEIVMSQSNQLSQELAETAAKDLAPVSYTMARITALVLLLIVLAVLIDWSIQLPAPLESTFYSVPGAAALAATICIHLLFRSRVVRAVNERKYRE